MLCSLKYTPRCRQTQVSAVRGALTARVVSAVVAFYTLYAVPPTALAGTATAVDAHEFPWSAVGRLNISGRGRCTATLIGPRHALTSAHCLYNPNRQRFYRPFEVRFLPAYQRQDYRLQTRAKRFITPEHYRYTSRPQPMDAAFDWAIIELEKPLGDVAGYLGMRVLTGEQLRQAKNDGARFVISGYRAKLGHVQSLQYGCKVFGFLKSKDKNEPDASARLRDVLIHNCKSTSGESGGPLLMMNKSGIQIVGVQSNTFPYKGETLVSAAALSALRNKAIAGTSARRVRELGLLDSVSVLPRSDSWISPKPQKTIARLFKGRQDGSTPISDHLLTLIAHAAAVARPQ